MSLELVNPVMKIAQLCPEIELINQKITEINPRRASVIVPNPGVTLLHLDKIQVVLKSSDLIEWILICLYVWHITLKQP